MVSGILDAEKKNSGSFASGKRKVDGREIRNRGGIGSLPTVERFQLDLEPLSAFDSSTLRYEFKEDAMMRFALKVAGLRVYSPTFDEGEFQWIENLAEPFSSVR